MVSADVPLLTCVVAAYNAQATVEAAIESVLNQGVTRAVVVDDGSTDGTADAVRRYGGDVRLIQQANGGPGAARNRGVAESDTEWIAFLDADDRWLPGHLEQWVQARQEHPDAAVFYSGAILTDSEGRIVGRQAGHRIVRDPFFDLLESNWVLTHGIFFRRSDFLDLGGFDVSHRHAEDWDLWIRLAARGGRWVRLPKDLIEYRQGEGSLSRDFDAMWAGVNWALQRAVRVPYGSAAERRRAAKRGKQNFRRWLYERIVAAEWRKAWARRSISGVWNSIGRRPVLWSEFVRDIGARW